MRMPEQQDFNPPRFTTDFSEGDARGWELTQHPGGSIELDNPKFGKLEFGKRPEGYGGWVFQELGGGGAVVLPYFTASDGQRYIGLLQVTRKTVDEGEHTIFEAIRGFKLKEASHTQSGIEEAQQEGGINLNIAERALEYQAVPGNPNSTFFVTHPSQGEGVKFVGIPFSENEMDKDEQSGYFRLKPEYFTGVREQMEGIKNESPVFVPVTEVSKITGDLFSRSGAELLLEEDVARLLSENAQLREQVTTLTDENASLKEKLARLEEQLASQTGASVQVASEIAGGDHGQLEATEDTPVEAPQTQQEHFEDLLMNVGFKATTVDFAMRVLRNFITSEKNRRIFERLQQQKRAQKKQQRHDTGVHAVHGVAHALQDVLPARARNWLLPKVYQEKAPVDIKNKKGEVIAVEQFVHVPHMQHLYRVITQNREQNVTGFLENESIQQLLTDYATNQYPDAPTPTLRVVSEADFAGAVPHDNEIVLGTVNGEQRYKIGLPKKSVLKTAQNRLKSLRPQRKTA